MVDSIVFCYFLYVVLLFSPFSLNSLQRYNFFFIYASIFDFLIILVYFFYYGVRSMLLRVRSMLQVALQ